MTSQMGWPGMVLPARNSAAAVCPATQCHLRSPVRSEDWPERYTPMMPHA
jgi:hypothetical protein